MKKIIAMWNGVCSVLFGKGIQVLTWVIISIVGSIETDYNIWKASLLCNKHR